MKTSPYIFRKILACMLVLLSQLPGHAQQVEKALTASNGTRIGFLEYKPSDYSTTTTKYPLIIFFHGIGERGNGSTDLYKVKRAGIPRYIEQGHKMRFFWNGKWETFLVLSPQLDASYGTWQNFYGEAMLNYAKKNMRIDTNRVFMAGLSLGGGAVWSYSSASTQNSMKLAAIAPACGICTMSNGCNIAKSNLPVWAEHAIDDPTVSVSCTNNAITNIKACNPAVAPIKVIYPTGGHAIWDRMFDTAYTWHDVNIYEWFLGQNKSLKPNILPVARATGNTAISLADGSTTLSGSTSTDADGTLVRYIWKQLNGPASASIASRRSVTTNVTGFTVTGKYQFQLTVVDNRANWTKDTITVTVGNTIIANKPPVAAAGSDISITLPVNSVMLDGTASKDPDGSITGIQWSLVGGPSNPPILRPASLVTDVTDLIEGDYSFRLIVSDDKGLKDTDVVKVTVLPIPNSAPIVKAGANQLIYLPLDSAYVAGSAIDLDGSITGYSWKQLSGPSAAVFTNPVQWGTEVKELIAGTYYFSLTATDDVGATGSDTVVITVKKSANQAPRIVVTKSLTIELPTDSVFVSAKGSFDPDGTIESYNWEFISGPDSLSASDASAMETWINNMKVGVYKFKLTVADNLFEKVSDTVTISVLPSSNKLPVARAGANIVLNLPDNSTTLDGSASSDPEGAVLGYSWRKIKGPAGDLILSADKAVTSIESLAEGIYLYELTVTDDANSSAADTIRITVKGALNLPPDADAGRDAEIVVSLQQATLDGSQSSDADGTIVSYSWVELSGNSGEQIADPAAPITSVNNLKTGTFVFELTVTDNDGSSAKDTVIIKVTSKPSKPPIAFAGNDFSVNLPIDTVLLAANGSYDTDGSIGSYQWTLISGPNNATLNDATSSIAGLSGLVEGLYEVELTVTDNDGLTATDRVIITVVPAGNTKPIASAGSDLSISLPMAQLSLDGSASYDPDGSIELYNWTQVSGPVQVTFNSNTIATPIIKGMSAGKYTFRLSITDDGGLTSIDIMKLEVMKAPNVAPIANSGADTTVSFGADYQLNGSASFDPDGQHLNYNWTTLSGPGGITLANSATATPTVTGSTGGQYIFRLTVTDSDGAESSDEVTVFIRSTENKAPIAYAGQDQTVALPETALELDASGSIDFDGEIVNYVWNQVAGPQDASISGTGTGVTIVTGMAPGTYQFELIVQDNEGAISRDTVSVKVINTQRSIANVLAYPNPAHDQVTIRLNADETGRTDIRLFDMYGHVLINKTTEKIDQSFQHTLYTQSLKPGLYLVEINIDDKKKMVTRLVKQ